MAKRYTRINWQNKPNTATPISAENLNKMDKAIDELDDAIGDLEQLKTTAKNSLVAAVNEVKDNVVSLGDDLDDLSTKIDSRMPISSARFDLSTPGWYRIARFAATSLADARIAAPVEIAIKKSYTTTVPQYLRLVLAIGWNVSQFNLLSKIGPLDVSKLRHTVDTNNNVAYIEMYYTTSGTNRFRVTLSDILNVNGNNAWETIAPVATSESVAGVTVVSSIDIT